MAGHFRTAALEPGRLVHPSLRREFPAGVRILCHCFAFYSFRFRAFEAAAGLFRLQRQFWLNGAHVCRRQLFPPLGCRLRFSSRLRPSMQLQIYQRYRCFLPGRRGISR
jgi:hypothetical protein